MSNIQQALERRAKQRSRCLKGARIVLANGNSTMACRIRNRSETGLRLSTDEAVHIPNLFTLVPDGATRGQKCQVTWRSPTEIGAEIVEAADLGAQGYNRSNPLLRMRKPQIVERYPI